MSPADTVDNSLSLAARLLESAREAMSEGREFDLVEFNEALSSACTGVIEMPQEKASGVRTALSLLLAKLEEFKNELERGLSSEPPAMGSGTD